MRLAFLGLALVVLEPQLAHASLLLAEEVRSRDQTGTGRGKKSLAEKMGKFYSDFSIMVDGRWIRSIERVFISN